MSGRVGFVGLGSMGGAIALRLARDVPLAVYDLRPESAEPLVASGAEAVSLEEMGRECEIVCCCLPTSEDVEQLVGEAGLAAAMQPGAVLVDMTTGSPKVDERIRAVLSERGIAFVDAPVSGGPRGAEQGTLCIMVGAEPEQFERVAPVLRHVSDKVVHVGPPGTGHVMKLVNNVMAAANRLSASEGVAIAVEHGIPLATCLDVLELSSGASWVTRVTFRRMAEEGKVAPHGFRLGLAAKDVRLARELFDGSEIPSWYAAQTNELLDRYERELGGDKDTNAVEKLYGSFGLPDET